MKKKLIGVLLLMVLIASLLAGCRTGEVASEQTENKNSDEESTVGVAMPTKDLQRWNQDGSNLKAQLEEAGYKVDLQYANNDIAAQIAQIETMVLAGVDILIIAPIDGESLETPLTLAKEAGIPVIAYDRLIMGTDAVSYYATFDNYEIGRKQGQYIEEALDLANVDTEVFNMEIFAGDPNDNNAYFVYHGAMDVLRKYIHAGVINIPSGKIDFTEVATPEWSTMKAQQRMETLLSSANMEGIQLDAILCSNDSIALGVTNALEAVDASDDIDVSDDIDAIDDTDNLITDDTNSSIADAVEDSVSKYPVMTGQDCDVENIKNLLLGKQAMDIFKDTRILAKQVVEMVEAILNDKEVPVNDTTTYDNGTGVIPTFLCEPVVITVENYVEILIESEYYTESNFH